MKINFRINFFFLFLGCFLFISCEQTETVEKEFVLRNSKEFKYELEIPVKIQGRGNIHSMSVEEYNYERSYWLYFNRREGILKPSEFIISDDKEKTDSLSRFNNVKGFIRITDDSAYISLKMPRYDDSDDFPDRWIPFEFNGRYAYKDKTR